MLADNENVKPKQEAKDSRTFGPVSLKDIVGRAIYCLRTAVDHGPVNNSPFSMDLDSPVLEVELDVDEMAKVTKHRLCFDVKGFPRITDLVVPSLSCFLLLI